MTLRPALRSVVSCVVLALAGFSAGCESQTTTVAGTPTPGERISPRVAVEAPTDLHDISGYLLRYRVTHQALPPALSDLRAQGVMPAEGYPGLGDYAYRATGLGTLADGRRVILVDTAIRVEGHAWCILAEPARNPRTATLAVSLVSMADLQAAARRSR